MFGFALLSLLVVGPWTCPDGVCGAKPPEVMEAQPDLHAREVRSIMRAFPRVRGQSPWFSTSEGSRIRRSDSVRTLERRLLSSDGLLYIHYGHCVSHSRTCPSAELAVDLEAEIDAREMTEARILADLPMQRVYKLGDDRAFDQEWLVLIPTKGDANREVAVWLIGNLGLERAALGSLPVRAIRDALARP